MIFLTVGTQLPFDRLVRAVDKWAFDNPQAEIYGQIGSSSCPPQHFDWSEDMPQPQFDARVTEADLIIAHAGMGSIISAMDLAKPIVIMPRLASHGEHRNDHQLATSSKFADLDNVFLACNEEELGLAIDDALNSNHIVPIDVAPSIRSLRMAVTDFIELEGRDERVA